MSTWEERMAGRARRGQLILDRETARRDAAERAAERKRERDDGGDLPSWLGPCFVCGQPIIESRVGHIDVSINENGAAYTWMFHPGGPLPDCGKRASQVYQVPDQPEGIPWS